MQRGPYKPKAMLTRVCAFDGCGATIVTRCTAPIYCDYHRKYTRMIRRQHRTRTDRQKRVGDLARGENIAKNESDQRLRHTKYTVIYDPQGDYGGELKSAFSVVEIEYTLQLFGFKAGTVLECSGCYFQVHDGQERQALKPLEIAQAQKYTTKTR